MGHLLFPKKKLSEKEETSADRNETALASDRDSPNLGKRNVTSVRQHPAQPVSRT